MKNTKLTIHGTTINPGEAANLAFPLPVIHSCSPLYMPIRVLHGKKKGPCILIVSILKGNEFNGLEIVNRVIEKVNIDEISGTIIAVPALNVFGLTHYPNALPSGRNITDCFPGKEDGNFGERMAYLFTQEILKYADCCIELQTGDQNHNILPQVYCNLENQEAKALAKAFQSPVITNVNIDGNSLRQTTEDLQIPLLVYQAGEAMRFDENAIELGVLGVKNVMRKINILPQTPSTETNPIFSQDEEWIVAHHGGILHTDVALGQVISEGEKIGRINDPFGTDFSEIVKAPKSGIVVGVNTTPLIYEGLRIFKVASFIDNDKAETVIEEWDKKQPDSYISN